MTGYILVGDFYISQHNRPENSQMQVKDSAWVRENMAACRSLSIPNSQRLGNLSLMLLPFCLIKKK